MITTSCEKCKFFIKGVKMYRGLSRHGLCMYKARCTETTADDSCAYFEIKEEKND
jgi:hypothetical protein